MWNWFRPAASESRSERRSSQGGGRRRSGYSFGLFEPGRLPGFDRRRAASMHGDRRPPVALPPRHIVQEDADGVMRRVQSYACARPRPLDRSVQSAYGLGESRHSRTAEWVAQSSVGAGDWHPPASGAPAVVDPPQRLFVECRANANVSGWYTLTAGQLRNNCPVWAKGAWRLHSNSAGSWMVSARRYMDRDVGVLCSADAHGGQTPDSIDQWMFFDDSGGWQLCTGTAVSTQDVRPHVAVGDGEPLAEVSEKSPASIAFAIDAFLRCYAPQLAEDPANGVALHAKVFDPGSSLDAVFTALADEHGVRGADRGNWRQPWYSGALLYRLNAFFQTFGEADRGQAPVIVQRIISSECTLEEAMQELCASYPDAVLGDWLGDYPEALTLEALRGGEAVEPMSSRPATSRPATSRPATSRPATSRSASSRPGELVVFKEPDEPLGITWTHDTVFESCAPGGAAERCGGELFVGKEVTEINGREVKTLAEVRQLVQGETEVRLLFSDPQAMVSARHSCRSRTLSDSAGDTLVVRKDADEPLGIHWVQDTMLQAVQGGSAADRSGGDRFLGRRVTHVNDAEVRTLAEVRARIQGARLVKLRFGAPLQAEAAPRGLLVVVPAAQRRCGGSYRLDSKMVNGSPAWRREGSNSGDSAVSWLYSTPQGNWGITDDPSDFETGTSYLYTETVHDGVWPHHCDVWVGGDGREVSVDVTVQGGCGPSGSAGGEPLSEGAYGSPFTLSRSGPAFDV
eukprot:TRINITY_DN1661_c0_g1_i1.p1 TRINITY_DN1661_c0_g1~~TRINITY_DN1661_c0_g1_i1.p1  ORF type:complete len:742 (+),score=187.99 TRINITY_DN1661_c0_g1_i1:64-2289(+)